MPKKEHRIVGFHGGINDNSDPKDIEDVELREADGVSINRLGRLTNVGNKDTALTNLATADDVVANIEPGYGLHYFSTDYDDDDATNAEDWLAIYDTQNSGRIRFYYRDKVGGSPDLSSTTLTVGAMKPNFYYADGILRVGDSGFSQVSKWHGYINSELYWTGIDATGDAVTNIHNISEWSNGEQTLKSFDKLNIELLLYDATSEGPDYADLEEGANFNRLLLSYWKNSGEGEWNGRYQFGATPIYIGNQEGTISEFNTHLNFYDDEVIFQVHIPTEGNSGSVSDNEVHLLFDNRIIGINFYFRTVGDDDWTFLMETDLTKGGQHFWKVYNAGESDGTTNSEKAFGYWVNPLAHNGVNIYTAVSAGPPATYNIEFSDEDDGSGTAWIDSSVSGAETGHSYYNVYLRVWLDNDNNDGFSGRKGFLRVWGGAVSPLYVNDIPLDTTGLYDEYYVPMVLPGVGTDREFRAQVLDENFTIIADSGIVTMTITESDRVAPGDYKDQTREP